jgi:hypothetical protein
MKLLFSSPNRLRKITIDILIFIKLQNCVILVIMKILKYRNYGFHVAPVCKMIQKKKKKNWKNVIFIQKFSSGKDTGTTFYCKLCEHKKNK